MEKYVFGIDVGGTTVKIGLFTLDGTVLDKWEVVTRKENDGELILPDIADSLNEKMQEKGIKKEEVRGIGVGVPGPVTEDGTVRICVNLGWGIFNVADKLRSLTGIENVKVNNDANVAALGEMWKGGGKGYRYVVMITLGTGVGGGVIYDGRILSGVIGAAGEIGHITVEFDEPDSCNCKKHGCLEQYASATGIVKEAKRLLAKVDTPSTIREIENLTAKDIFDAAKEKDELSIQLVEQLGMYLGRVTSHVAATVDPEVFVIGGGVSKAGTILTEVIKRHYEENVMEALKNKEFKLAELGNDAGIFGSAKMVLD